MSGPAGKLSATSPLQGPMEPDTPAPLFALRAFKSALFGSPGGQPEPRTRTPKAKMKRRSSPSRSRPAEPLPVPTPLRSPKKSILITPGTARTERKAVSFKDAPPRRSATQQPRVEDGDDHGSRPLSPSPTSGRNAGRSKRPAHRIPTVEIVARSPLQEIQIQLSSPSTIKPIKDEGAERTQVTPSDPAELGTNDSQEKDAARHNEDLEPNRSGVKTPSTKCRSSHTSPQASGSSWLLASYRSRSDRQLKRLFGRYEIVKAYARMKDQEATELAIKVQKLQEENRKLAAELIKAKKGDQINPVTNASPDRHLDSRSTDAKLAYPRAKTKDAMLSTIHQPSNQPQERTDRHRPAEPSPTDSIPLPSTWTAESSTASAEQEAGPGSPPHRSPVSRLPVPNSSLAILPSRSSLESRPEPQSTLVSPKLYTLAPDRLAAAKARLRLRAEQRRRTKEEQVT